MKKYREALVEAAREANCTTVEVEAAVARDFGKWIKQERLPRLNPPTEGE